MEELKKIKGKTSGGFEFEIDPGIADDMELLELLAEADRDSSKLPGLLDRMLGKDQKARLYDFIRDPETGRVPIAKCVALFNEILEEAGEDTKN